MKLYLILDPEWEEQGTRETTDCRIFLGKLLNPTTTIKGGTGRIMSVKETEGHYSQLRTFYAFDWSYLKESIGRSWLIGTKLESM